MKNKMKTTAQLILAAALVLTACKKKEETNIINTPVGTTTGAPVVVRTMTASVNGVAWQAHAEAYSMSSTNTNYTFGGQTAFSPNAHTAISFNLPRPLSVGNYTFSNTGAVLAYYKDVNSAFYISNAGNINITQVDTASAANGIITKLKATFSFTTDAVSNQSYTVSNGVIDYNK